MTARTFREIKKSRVFLSTKFQLTYTVTWITGKELEGEIKNNRPVALELMALLFLKTRTFGAKNW